MEIKKELVKIALENTKNNLINCKKCVAGLIRM